MHGPLTIHRPYPQVPACLQCPTLTVPQNLHARLTTAAIRPPQGDLIWPLGTGRCPHQGLVNSTNLLGRVGRGSCKTRHHRGVTTAVPNNSMAVAVKNHNSTAAPWAGATQTMGPRVPMQACPTATNDFTHSYATQPNRQADKTRT